MSIYTYNNVRNKVALISRAFNYYMYVCNVEVQNFMMNIFND